MAELPQLHVAADLRLDVDGVQAQIAGNGDRLRITTEHPVLLMRRSAPLIRLMTGARARSGLEQLSAQGLTITLAGPRSELIRFGADAGRQHVRLVVPHLPRTTLTLTALAALAIAVRTRRR